MWTFWGEQIDPGKLTKQQSDGQVYRRTKRQMDTQTAGAREGMMEMKKKETEKGRCARDSTGLDTIWHKVLHCFCFSKTGQ